jgi:hypothetical protein
MAAGLLSFVVLPACRATDPILPDSGETGTDGAGLFEADQPQYPVEDDDPFFHAEAESGVAFRILIARGNYQVRQVQLRNSIARREDPVGDREQMEFFTGQLEEIDFVDMILKGTIEVRLSPLTGQIEHISYANGQNPRTWQASKYFQDDVSRFRFYDPDGASPVRNFQVEYEWRIDKRKGISDEENRRRAVEWLKKETR